MVEKEDGQPWSLPLVGVGDIYDTPGLISCFLHDYQALVWIQYKQNVCEDDKGRWWMNFGRTSWSCSSGDSGHLTCRLRPEARSNVPPCVESQEVPGRYDE